MATLFGDRVGRRRGRFCLLVKYKYGLTAVANAALWPFDEVAAERLKRVGHGLPRRLQLLKRVLLGFIKYGNVPQWFDRSDCMPLPSASSAAWLWTLKGKGWHAIL